MGAQQWRWTGWAWLSLLREGSPEVPGISTGQAGGDFVTGLAGFLRLVSGGMGSAVGGVQSGRSPTESTSTPRSGCGQARAVGCQVVSRPHVKIPLLGRCFRWLGRMKGPSHHFRGPVWPNRKRQRSFGHSGMLVLGQTARGPITSQRGEHKGQQKSMSNRLRTLRAMQAQAA